MEGDFDTCTFQGVPNGWERVPLSNPLGFKHHPLEGAGSLSKEIPWQIPSGNSNDLGISGVRIFFL